MGGGSTACRVAQAETVKTDKTSTASRPTSPVRFSLFIGGLNSLGSNGSMVRQKQGIFYILTVVLWRRIRETWPKQKTDQRVR